MLLKHRLIGMCYRGLVKPVAFRFDAEAVHNRITALGEALEKRERFLDVLFAYRNKRLNRCVLGIPFENPIGLAAGFDYDGHLAAVMQYVGFGFNTVGTVTAKPYGGNEGPRLGRLPRSQSLLVNKGFKSEGAITVAARLDKKALAGHTIGVSVGSTNSPEVRTIPAAIEDYLFTFDVFRKKSYVRYFELNISCPNVAMGESFSDATHFRRLAEAIVRMHLSQPIFVKMPNEVSEEQADALIRIALKNNIRGFVFSNLVKNRKNPAFDQAEMCRVAGLRGNFSGKPTQENARRLVAHVRRQFGSDVALIGCGGVFGVDDAKKFFDAGADLVQLITGMIFRGPQLAGEIAYGLATQKEDD